MTYLQWIVAAVVMVSVLVVIHEFGHFLAARLFGVGTKVFSIGMGPRVWGVRLFDTDFRISAFPIGGYVQMAGADPFGDDDPDAYVAPEQDFMRKPVWQRLIIMFAGPAMNLALPLVLFTAVLMMGEPKLPSHVRTVYDGSAAEDVGLRVGDHIAAVDGQPVDVWDDLVVELERRVGQPVSLAVQHAGQPDREVQLPAESIRLARDGSLDMFALGVSPRARSTMIGVVDPSSPAGRAGLRSGDAIVTVDGTSVRTWEELQSALTPGASHEIERLRAEDGKAVSANVELVPDPAWARPEWSTADTWGLEHPATFVGSVSEGSAAEQAGVQAGDRILAIDGTPVRDWEDVLVLVARTARDNDTPRPLKLDLARDGEPMSLTFQPTWDQEIVRHGVVNYRPLMGIAQYPNVEIALEGDLVRKYYTFGEALSRAGTQTREAFSALLRMVWNMVSNQVAVTDALGGPVAIVREAGEAAQGGIFRYVRTMAIISLSLGVVNLVPFPLLDGGQIVFYLIEGVRGRPLPIAIRDRIQMIGVLALIALLLVVTVNDLSRWIGG